MKSLKAILLLCLSCTLIINKGYSNSINAPKLTAATPTGNAPLASEQLRTDLYSVNADSSVSLEDGNLELYNKSFSDSVNFLEDAKKLTQFLENFAIARQGQLLAIEKRQPIGVTDTVFYNMTQMAHKPYKLIFTAVNLNHPNLFGFLEDSYTGTSTPINLNGSTTVDFSVTADTATANPNRFRVVFVTISVLSGIVPLTYTGVEAFEQNKNISVEWKTENELNVSKYEVERSLDGLKFTDIASVAPSGGAASSYSWVDTDPATGNNFYRIKEMDNTGKIEYSQVMKVTIGKADNISVYPNPVISGIIELQMNDLPTGNYKVILLNNFGQAVFTKSISHVSGSPVETISTNQTTKGIYRVEVIHPDNSATNITVVI